MTKVRVWAIAATSVAVLATGCSFGGSDKGSSSGAKSITVEYQNFPILDPQRVGWGEWITGAGILEGLVDLNADGTGVVPATADTWKASRDGRVYTFHIRDTAKWSDGQPVTAADFEWTYKRLFTPGSGQAAVTTGANSYVVSTGISGAIDFLSGKLKDWSKVGVKAPDAHTVQLTLDKPNAGFLQDLAYPAMVAMPEHVVSKHQKDWQTPANFVGNGPYVVKAWNINSSMTLTPNKYYWDQKSIGLKQINVRLSDESQAALHFRNKEIDVGPIGSANLKPFQQNKSLADQLVRMPAFGLSYLAVMHSKNPLLQDQRVREALALGMTRTDMAKTCAGCRPAYALVSDSVPGYNKSVELTEDVAKARKLLAAAGYPGGKGLPPIHIVNDGANPVLEAIADTWKRNLGVTTKIEVLDPGVYVEKRAALQPANYIGFYYGSFSQLPSWQAWTTVLWGPDFTSQFSLSGADWATYTKMAASTAANSGIRAQTFVAQHRSAAATQFVNLVTKAAQNLDPDKATQQFMQAARIRRDTDLFIPTVISDSFWAVRKDITGLHLRSGFYFPFYFKGVSVAGTK